MIGNAVFGTTVIFLALALYVMEECQFLIPYRHVIFVKYGTHVAVFGAALFGNLFAAIYLLWRKVFLKDTGRKLAHVEKQLRSGEYISAEISRHLKDEYGPTD